MRLLKVLPLVFVLAFSLSAEAKKKKTAAITKMSGVVERCHDGDTCHVLVSGKRVKVRFAGIDTPEIKQSNGVQARNFTESLIKGKAVDLECDGTSFDRITCTVYQAGVNVNSEIVRNGWAYESVKYSKGRYSSDLSHASSNRLGIWKDGKSVSPYCFRKSGSKHCKANQSYMP